ncbi:carbohydrate-binding protein [Streptomyces sp. NPDC002506]|uniref:carbohydrate-binding protein n=1 Tax=Streptomyces sp. NPDC002506 TaxID=3154536 RepID=UPI00332E8E30
MAEQQSPSAGGQRQSPDGAMVPGDGTAVHAAGRPRADDEAAEALGVVQPHGACVAPGPDTRPAEGVADTAELEPVPPHDSRGATAYGTAQQHGGDGATAYGTGQLHHGDGPEAFGAGQPAGADETMVFDLAHLPSRRRRSGGARRRVSAGVAGALALAGAGILAFGGGGPDNLATLMGSSGHGAGAPDTVPSTTPSTAEEQAGAAGQASPDGSPARGATTPGHPSASDAFRSTPSAPGTDGPHGTGAGGGTGAGAVPSVSQSASRSSHPASPSPVHSDGPDVPAWQANGSYRVGDRVTFNGVVFRCRQNYVGHGDPGYIESEALWQRQR